MSDSLKGKIDEFLSRLDEGGEGSSNTKIKRTFNK